MKEVKYLNNVESVPAIRVESQYIKPEIVGFGALSVVIAGGSGLLRDTLSDAADEPD